MGEDLGSAFYDAKGAKDDDVSDDEFFDAV